MYKIFKVTYIDIYNDIYLNNLDVVQSKMLYKLYSYFDTKLFIHVYI